MRRFARSILGILITLIILGIIFCTIDINFALEARRPLFSIKRNKNEITEGAEYVGLGYKLFTYKKRHDMIVEKGIWFTSFDRAKEEYTNLRKQEESAKEELKSENENNEQDEEKNNEEPKEKTEEEKLNEKMEEEADEITIKDGEPNSLENFNKLLDSISKKEAYKLKIHNNTSGKEGTKLIIYEPDKIQIIEKNDEAIIVALEKEAPEIKQKEENNNIIYFINNGEYDYNIMETKN